MTWSTATPQGTDFISLGDDVLRELKADIQTALRGDDTEGTEAVFPGGDTANPVYRYRGIKDTTANRPAAAHYGLFFDTTRNVLQRSNGTTWDDIATMIPSGTVSVFYQASAPTGWTAVALNDKFLRVVTAGGTGGTTGGTVAASTSLAHTHTVASHTHTGPSHTHSVSGTTASDGAHTHTLGAEGGGLGSGSGYYTDSAGAHTHTFSTTTDAEGTGNTGAATPATDSQLGAFAYADIIVATKD